MAAQAGTSYRLAWKTSVPGTLGGNRFQLDGNLTACFPAQAPICRDPASTWVRVRTLSGLLMAP